MIASSEDLADGVIQIDGYDYVGYLRYPSVQKTSLREPKAMQETKPLRRNDQNKVQVFHKWKHKRV